MPKIYRHLINPETYPAYKKRPVKVVTRPQLGNKIQFLSTRFYIPVGDRVMQMSDYLEELDRNTVQQKLGNIVWPVCSLLKSELLPEVVAEVKKRGLYMFDIWGYVPGSFHATEMWSEYEVKPETLALLTSELGDHFLGFDNGEQDGRYVGGYAGMLCPSPQDRRAQYLNFQKHFEKLGDALQHQLTALCSLYYGHYFLKENDTIIIGSECAQALPNVNLWYAFNRGAGKQYGVLWFGNASVWNRWGYKNYSESGKDAYEWGPEFGTSASLLRRMLYTHYAYNCDILGFEIGWLYEGNCDPKLRGELTPVGRIQTEAIKFVEKQGYAGAMHTPVAILLDFFTGFTPPRHLYSNEVYKNWGNLPYDGGDYQTHALFDLLYPGYEDASFFRDERGYLTATPYGDMFDVLLSDAELELLNTYNRLVISGNFDIGVEEFDKLRQFTQEGGTLHIFMGSVANSLHHFAQDKADFLKFFGLHTMEDRITCPDGTRVRYKGKNLAEKSFELYKFSLDSQAEIVARTEDGRPVIYEIARGAGRLCVVAVPFGINKYPAYDLSRADQSTPTSNAVNESITQPFDLLATIKAYLGDNLDKEKLVDLNPQLAWTVNLVDATRLRLTVTNNTSQTQRFEIKLRSGSLSQVEELAIHNVKEDNPGYYPLVFNPGEVHGVGSYSIEPLDLRMFLLTVADQAWEEKEELTLVDRTQGKYLKLAPDLSIRQQILLNPTMTSHFAGIAIPARYLMEREQDVLEHEAGFVKRRGLKAILDFSSLMNHYPDLSLLDNLKERYRANLELIENTLDKASLYDCQGVIIIPHRNAENHVTPTAADRGFARSIARIANLCRSRGLALYLQNGTPARHQFLMPKLVEWIDQHHLPVKIAWNPAHSLESGEELPRLIEQYGARISAVLLSAPIKDLNGQWNDAHQPLHLSPWKGQILEATNQLKKTQSLDFVTLDAVYQDFNQVYRDIKWLE